MRPLLTLPCAILLFAAFAFAQTAPDRDERWRRDVDAVAQQLPQLHPNLFTRVTREDFNAAAARLMMSIPRMQDFEVAVGLQQLVAMGGDAHTTFNVFQAGTGVRQLPLRVQWFDDGLFVTNTNLTYTRAIGARITAIAGRPIDEVYDAVKTVISYENDNWARVRSETLLVSGEVLTALGIASAPAGIEYSFEKNGESFNLIITNVSGNIHAGPQPARLLRPLYTRNREFPYWFDYIPEARTLYMQYNSCEASAGLSIADFTREVVDFIRANPVEKLVLDLRWNSGGNSAIIQPFFLAIGDLLQRGEIPTFRGGYTIIGRHTFSSGMLNAIDSKRGGVTLVGLPTGGNPLGYGEVRSLQLPSGLIVSYSTRQFQLDGFPGPALFPDIEVGIKSTDYFAGRDPMLEAVLAHSPR